MHEYGLLEKDRGVNAPYDHIVIRAALRDTQAALSVPLPGR